MSEFKGFLHEEEEQVCPDCQQEAAELADMNYLIHRFVEEAVEVSGEDELIDFIHRVVTISHSVGKQAAFETIVGFGVNVSESLDHAIDEMLNGDIDTCDCDECCCEE